MMTKAASFAVLSFAAAALAQELSHPALTPDLEYVNPGNTKYHKVVSSSTKAYPRGKIPADCKAIANEEGFPPSDFITTYVTYTDCADPWLFCRHKDSPVTLQTMRQQFGRIPVGMRDLIAHVVSIPYGDGAYNVNDNIVFYGTSANTYDVWVHEIGHSLDAIGGATEADYGFSDQQRWVDAYNKDTKVADDYARTDQAENFAQETVLALFDTAVPGGFPTIQPDYKSVQTQYKLIETTFKKIRAGGRCNRVVQPSGPVPVSGAASFAAAESKEPFSGNYTTPHRRSKQNTKGHCKF